MPVFRRLNSGSASQLLSSKMGAKTQTYTVYKFLSLSLCVWRSDFGPRVDRRNTEQCCWGMMLPSYSNFVIIHFPKHSLPFLPPGVADFKKTKKKLACQQLNFLDHNKSISLGGKREQEFLSCLHGNGVMNWKNIHLA